MNIKKGQFINVANIFWGKLVELMNSPDYKRVRQAIDEFDKKRLENGGSVPIAPELNSSIWLDDVRSLFYQSCYALAWIKAWRQEAGDKINSENINHFYIQYYIDDISVMLLSARDKLFLSILSYFIPFDPRKHLLAFKDAKKQLKTIKRAAEAKGRCNSSKIAENILWNKLKSSCWNEVKTYRDAKVHRREPYVTLRETNSIELRYWIPVSRYDEIIKAEDEWKKTLTPQEAEDLGIKSLPLGSPIIDGVTYLRGHIAEPLSYEKIIDNFEKVFHSIAESIKIWTDHLKDEYPYGRSY